MTNDNGQVPPAPSSPGPLSGIRVIELAGIGPGPFATMLLADWGAEVIRIDRPGSPVADEMARRDLINRGKRSIAVNLKSREGVDLVRRLGAEADVFVEGFRPGVAERLGLGPDELTTANPALVYARMTGWGQEGPLAHAAGHDIDYIALTGALWATGRADEAPVAPLNLLGDYAGGSMFLVAGVLAALVERSRSGAGQVIDAAMIDGATVLTSMFTALAGQQMWDLGTRGGNFLDSAAPWYDVYACADGKWLAVGALEPQFYADLVRLSGFREGAEDRFDQPSPEAWPALKAQWAAHWLTRDRDDWATLLGNSDACVQPVLDWTERSEHPHVRARDLLPQVNGVRQPAPAPRFSRSVARIGSAPPAPGEHTDDIARLAGLTAEETEALVVAGALARPQVLVAQS